MKKVILLCVVALTFMACPSDDDVTADLENPIVGTWKFFQSFENGVEETLDNCENEETLVFSTDGMFSGSYYDDINGDCVLEYSSTGTWSNVGNAYDITIEGESSTENVTFEDNTFYIEYTESSGGTDPVIYTYKEVYIRQ